MSNSTFTVDGKVYLVKRPTLKQQQEGQKVYNMTFSEAVQSKALLRTKLEDFMKEQNLWNDQKMAEFTALQKEILDLEKLINRGGCKLTEAKEAAVKLRHLRNELRELTATRLELDVHTAEGQADNARFNYWVSVCLVYNDSGKPVFNSVDEYVGAGNEVSLTGAQHLAQLMYGMEDNFEAKLPENKFLKEYGFVDEKLRLINKDGKLVDERGRLINEEGRLINEEGQLVDFEGNVLDAEGNYVFQTQPFLDDDGNPIVPTPKEETVTV